MYRFQRSAVPAQGKVAEATEWAVQIGALADKLAPDAKVKTLATAFGDTGIHWFFDAPDLATLERWMTRVESDPGYREMVAKSQAQGLLLAGTLRTVLYGIPRG